MPFHWIFFNILYFTGYISNIDSKPFLHHHIHWILKEFKAIMRIEKIHN